MGTGKLLTPDLNRALEACRGVSGDLAEVGVYRGHLFRRLADAAAGRGCVAHAFDTFAGMGEPGELDDAKRYPEGALDSGGCLEFAKGLPTNGSWRLWPGLIPAGFDRFDADDATSRLAFAYVDVDHFMPTLTAAVWCWGALLPGGVLGFDDYYAERRRQAAGAINWFLACVEPAQRWETDNRQLFLVKP